MDDDALDPVRQAIRSDEAALAVTGVLSVRAGYRLVNGWPSREPAVVATVESGATAASLPDSVGGFPVDVREASPAKRLRLADPNAYLRTRGDGPDADTVPEFDDELVPAAARAHDGSSARLVPVPPLPDAEEAAGAAGDRAAAGKPELDYTAPTGVALAPITVQTTVTTSVSPDNGWQTLKGFLGAVTTSLDVAMYDFTSAHVLDAVRSLPAAAELSLVLDHPAKNPTADQTDDVTVSDLASTFGDRFSQAWALEREDPHATAWIFPSAYHIKVAVRDRGVASGVSTWISSGNWNDSNQPDIDTSTSAGAATARTSDRDWHLVVDGQDLADVFGAYVDHDRTVAAAHNAPAASGAPAADDRVVLPAVETPPFSQFFAPAQFSGSLTITPLLTPDPGVYVDAVKALIAGARERLHMQFQYIKLPTAGNTAAAAFVDLVNAVIERQKAGVEVQVIMAQWETAGYLEQLQAAGLDIQSGVRIQGNVHNKGIVVDGSTVLVSSQNWSSAGVLQNRDAGVIVEHAGIAGYFDQVFAHDWEHLAAAQATAD